MPHPEIRIAPDFRDLRQPVARIWLTLRRHNPAGDILWIKGKVTRKSVENGRHLVAIEQEARQQDDELSILGTGIVELPSRGR